VPEKERVASVAVRLPREPPRAMPEMVEKVKPALSKVPVKVGVKVRAPEEGMMVKPIVSPLRVRVEVLKVIVVAVVEA
jgi:hypothetical protein